MVDLKKLANEATKREVIYPNLEFSPDGDKFAEGRAIVRFDQPMLRVVEYKDRETKESKEFLVILVTLEQPSDFGQLPGVYQLRTPAKSSTLTDGVLMLSQKHKDNLMGVRALIQTENYNHKKHGKTRAYRITEVTGDRTPVAPSE